jgi:hypothetical protein
MFNRLKKLGVATAAATILMAAPSIAQAATIVVFGQVDGTNTVTGTEVGGITTISATTPSIITTLNEAGANLPATFSLSMTSSAPATNVSGDLWAQSYDGTFSILGDGGFNYLSGVFSGVTLGLNGGNALIFGAAQPPGSLMFTSDVPGIPLDFPTAMALGFTNAQGISISNGSFGDFTSNVSGTFSAADSAPVPEPATMVLLGTGLLAAFRARRKQQA